MAFGDRRAPMPRGKPLERGGELKRTGRLAPESARTKAQKPLRRAVRERVHERDQETCQASVRIPGHVCASPFPDRPELEVHEMESRGVHPGSHLVDDLCVLLCQRAHDAATSDPESPEWRLFRWRSSYDKGRSDSMDEPGTATNGPGSDNI